MAYPVADPYRAAIRQSATVHYSVSASLDGVPAGGATDLRPIGGSIVDTTRPGVRRTLNLQLAPADGLFDALSPVGTTLTVTAHVRYAGPDTVQIPMGVFDVDTQSLEEGGGSLSLTAPDLWVRIQRARFVQPFASMPETSVVNQIGILIRSVFGAAQPVNVLATSTALMGALVWEQDRAKAIIDLARDIGAWVYFDREGVPTIADIPTIGDEADWLVNAGENGVLTELSRERSRTNTRNVVVVSSSATDAEKFPTQIVWDNDPNSPTYAGPDPVNSPHLAGPFGVVPEYHDTPLPLNVQGARALGRTILARRMGLASQVSAGQVPNPAADAFDVLDVLPPGWGTVAETVGAGDGSTTTILRRLSNRALERHIADTVTHPLTVGGVQQIEGRSTRVEELS